MRALAGLVAMAALAVAPVAQAKEAQQARMGPVAAMFRGICLLWVAGVPPKQMVTMVEARGIKASWVGDRLAGFDMPTLAGLSFSAVTLGENAARCEIHLTYAKTRVAEIAADIDALTPSLPPRFRLAPVTPARDRYGNTPDRAWAAPGAIMTLTEKPNSFPGSTERDATLYLERK